MRWSFVALWSLALVGGQVELTSPKKFDEFVKKYPISLVEFYAPWCGHCRALKPAYAEATEILAEHNPPIPLAVVDATVGVLRPIVDKYRIDSFPAIKIFFGETAPGNVHNYPYGRKTEDIVKYMKEIAGPPLSVVGNSTRLEKFLDAQPDSSLVGFFNQFEGPDYIAFRHLVRGIDKMYPVSMSLDPVSAEKYGFANGEEGAILFLSRRYESERETLVNRLPSWDMDEMIGYMNKRHLPLVADFNQFNMQRYKANYNDGAAIVTMYYALSADGKTYDVRGSPVMEELRRVASALREKGVEDVYFTVREISRAARELDLSFGGATVEDEYITTLRRGDNEKYVTRILVDLNKGRAPAEFSAEGLGEWVEKVLDGCNAEQIRRSQTPPEQPTVDGLTSLVAENFDELVMDSKKKSIVLLYATTGPRIKEIMAVAPVWDELAATLESEEIIVGKFDVNENDLPGAFKWHPNMLPMVYFKDSDGEPEHYVQEEAGEPTVDMLLRFLQRRKAVRKLYVEMEEDEEPAAIVGDAGPGSSGYTEGAEGKCSAEPVDDEDGEGSCSAPPAAATERAKPVKQSEAKQPKVKVGDNVEDEDGVKGTLLAIQLEDRDEPPYHFQPSDGSDPYWVTAVSFPKYT